MKGCESNVNISKFKTSHLISEYIWGKLKGLFNDHFQFHN